MPTHFEDLLGDVRVIPVITISDVDAAIPLAQALVAGGLPVLEVTLRTEAGLHAIAQIARCRAARDRRRRHRHDSAAVPGRARRRRAVHRLAGLHRRARCRRRVRRAAPSCPAP